MNKTLYVLNGPNLNLLGVREPDIYGCTTSEDVHAKVQAVYSQVEFKQTNSETELINWIQEIWRNHETCLGVIINPAAFTHYSYALRDALAILRQDNIHIFEVHISNPHAREDFRHNSVVSPTVDGTIAGFGIDGYVYAAQKLLELESM